VKLLLLSDKAGDNRKILTMTTIIGRSSLAGFRVNDQYASPNHAIIAPHEDGWAVADLGSTNGTRVNGLTVHGACQLAKGDQIRVGHTILIAVPVS
jgi:pSer/pThr/pTyr-binding forkhead associated (FHA) protein